MGNYLSNVELEQSVNMNLIIDVGNTLSKVAVFNDDSIVFHEKHSTLSVDAFEKILRTYPIGKAIFSSTGEFPVYIEEFLSQRLPLLRFCSETLLPIKNCYKTPQTLGADRLAAAVGAFVLFPHQNVLSIDSGTAITYDLVTCKGEYLGGAISPGIEMRFKALHQFTVRLPLISFNTNHPLIGYDTETSILSGVLNGVLAEVDGYIAQIGAQYPPLTVVFTGGNSIYFDKKLKNSIFVNPNLVLFGLNRILEYNENH